MGTGGGFCANERACAAVGDSGAVAVTTAMWLGAAGGALVAGAGAGGASGFGGGVTMAPMPGV